MPYKDVWVEHFGAEVVHTFAAADTDTTDNAPRIQSAIEYMKGGGEIRLADGYYRLESTVTIPYRVRLTGTGRTLLFADHANGAILHVTGDACLTQVACLSSTNRGVFTDPRCVGIRFGVFI